jgi:hypothetical protein
MLLAKNSASSIEKCVINILDNVTRKKTLRVRLFRTRFKQCMINTLYKCAHSNMTVLVHLSHISQAEHGEAVRLTKGGRLDDVLSFECAAFNLRRKKFLDSVQSTEPKNFSS